MGIKNYSKKVITFSVALFVLLSLVVGLPTATQAVPPDDCPVDMIGYWRLDEAGAPTSFEDHYGSYDGACSPFGCPVPVAGQVNGGQQIAGGNSGVGIDIPADPSGTAPFDWAADQSFSIAFWMNRSGAIGENDVIIGRDEQGPGASSLHWWIGVQKNSGLPFCNLIATSGDGAAVTGTTNINDGIWHHVVFVRDAAAGVNLIYVDGNQTPEGTTNKASYSAGFGSTTAAINIGWLSLDTKYTYDGIVDEVALYNQALTPVEIEQQYMDGLAQIGHCESTYEPPPCPAETTGYWRLDETGTPTSFEDFVGGNTAACAGACPAPAGGIVNGGQVFSLASGTGLDVAATDELNWGVDDSFSVEFWMTEPGDISGNAVIIGRQGPSHPNPHIWIGVNSGGVANFSLHANDTDEAVIQGSTNLTTGGWHHIVAVRERTATTDQIRIYVDSAEEGVMDHTFSSGFETTTPLNIGWLNLGGGFRYDGKLDEVAIYKRALTVAEIEQHYTDGLAGFAYCEVYPVLDTDGDGIPDDVESAVGCCLNPNDDDTDDDGIIDGNEDLNYDCVIDPGETDPCVIDTDGDGIDDGIEIGLAAPQGSDTDPLVFNADADGGATTTNPVNPDTDGDGVDDGVEDADQDGAIDPGETDPTVNDNCPAGMIGYWTLDETGTPTSFEDHYGSYDGACSPFGCPVPVAGQVNGGQQIAGGNSGVGIDIPADPSGTAPFDWAADQSFSIAFWMNRSGAIGENDVIIGRDEQGPGASSLHWWIGVQKNSGLPFCNLIATSGDGAAVTGTTNINDGIWHHVVFVRDAAAGVNLIYVDGNQTPEGTTNKASYSAGFGSTTAAINIGWLSLDTKYTYDGIVDEVALYNQALTPVEIEQQYMDGLAQIGHCESTYEPPPCPAETTGYWRLDETGTPTSFEDFVGGNTAACAGACPAPAGGIVNGGQVFSLASGTGLDVAATDELNWGVDDSFSVEFWMTEPGDISGNAVIIGRQGPSHPNPHIWIGVNSGGVANFSLHANDTDEAVIQGSTNLTTGGWHHIVAVRERTATTDQIRIYVDSAEEGVMDHTFSSGFETTTPLNIGWLNLGGGFRYDGKLDEVAIYKRALTVAEIEQHYTDGLAGFAYCEVYPVLDTDGDGIPDDVESAVGCCLNPNDDDTDDDGIIDGNEDLNYDCVIDPGETDPCVIDTDGDGIDDGIEIGLAAPQGSDTDPLVFNADADGGATTTNPVNPDTDGDGVDDGIEDANQNGAVDAGETDPAVNENCPADMTAYYMLDESTAPYADYQNGPDAACTNCPTADADSVIGNSQAFDGVNDEVNVNDTGQFDWAADDSFTIEYWMKKGTACNGNEVIVGRDDGSGLHWWTGCQDDGTVRFQLKNSSDAGLYLGGTGDTINDGDWHHLVFVRDESTDENRIYVDGVNTHSGNYDYTAGFGSSVPLNIGYLNAGGHYRYDGLLDEVAIYNRALSAAEIEQQHRDGQAQIGHCDAGPGFITLDLEKSTDMVTWSDMSGNLDTGFSMTLDPNVEYHYLNVTAAETNRPLVENEYGFYVDTYPAEFFDYWASRGVDVNADPSSWQGVMWQIINGNLPIFYLQVSAGPTYKLLDGLQYELGLTDEYLRVNGTYHPGAYSYTGNITDINGNSNTLSIDMTFVLPSNCPTDLISYWKLDETGTPTSFEDNVGNNDGWCPDICPTPTTDALVVGAQVFDGNSTGIDALGATYDWAAGASFSIEFWMRRDNGPIPGNQISDNEVIIGRDYPDPLSHWWFGLWNNGAAHFQLTDNSGDMISIDGPAVDDSQWHHLVGVRDGVNNINRLFVDGVEVPGSPVGHTYSNGFGSPAALNIGWLAPYSDFHFEGTLDEIAVYDRALTAAEIQHHFTNGQEGHGGCEEVVPQIVSIEETEATVGQPYTYDVNATGNPAPTYALTEAPAGMTIDPDTGLIQWTPTGAGDFDVCVEASHDDEINTQCFIIHVAGPTGCPSGMAHYWKLDDTVGSTFTDAFGGTDGTCTDCPTRVDGILGSARSFNGSSNEINVPDDGSFDWEAADEFSIELWITRPLPQPIPENDVIVGRDDRSTGLHWWVGLNTSGQPMFVLVDNDSSDGNTGGNSNWPTSDENITDDDLWHHIVAVKDATHIRIYVDGAEKSIVPKAYNDGFGSDVPLNIGWLSLDKKYTYDGIVDEVALHNRALTINEIQEHYNEGAGRGYCSPATPPTDVNLASYWKLDELAPAFYEDMVGSNDGGCREAGNCPSPTAAGKLDGGQIFDRSLQTGINAPGQDFNWSKDDSFTVAFWMNKDSACSGSATGNNEVIVGRDDANSDLHWWVGVGCNATYPQQGGATFNLIDKNTGEADTAIYGETDLTDGNWHLVVVQRDGLLQENRLYVDGKLESKISVSYSDGFDSATEPINIGWLNLSPNYYYTGILDEVAIYNSALSEPEIRFLYYLGRDYRDRCSQPIKVMELGDSITYDNYGGDTRTAGNRTGYRSHLWWMLTDAGYNVDFVGSVVAGQDYVPAFDPDNAGYPGATDDQIVGLLQTGISPKSGYPGTPTPPGGPYLDYYQPDIILLHIGTNGLCSSGPVCADAVANILDEVDDYELRVGKEAVVLVARIIARQNDSCSVDTDTIFGSSTNTSTSNFNNFVEDMVLNRIAGGDNVILLDMECGANINYITEMIDSLHPDPFLTFFGGYEKMAYVWMNGNSHEDALGLTDVLPVCGPPEPAQPVITSEPVLQAYSGWFYKYDVDADGYPAPEYRLVESPPDMTIDSANGIITWLAGDIGPYDVIVEAYNSEASIPQEFTIQVEEAPPCPVDMNHYLKLDEDTSGIYNDLFSSNNGECAGNCPDPDIGIVSGAQVFNRSAGTGINVPADTSFDWGGSESFSIEFWMKKDPGTEPCSGSDTNANEVLVGRDDASTQLHWWVGVGCNTSYPTQGGAVFNLIDTNAGESGTSDISGQTGTSVYGSTNLIDGTWHHIVVARDGLVNRLFVDGILEDALTLPYSNGFESASAPINIGWLNLSNGFRFSGTLDEVAMYNRALQEPEIQEHYSNGLCSKGYCEPIVPVTVPNVVGLPQAEAEAAIAAADLRVGTVTKTPSDTIPIGEVINQSPVDGVEVPSCSAVDIEVSLGDVSYFQDFEGYEVGADPDYWLDTGANNSLTEDDSLFKTADVDGDMAFGTSSTLTNIHSHYLAETYDAMEGFVFTGRMRMSASNSGIGVTFLSDYPDSDTYYRLRRYGTNAFHLSSHNTAALSGVTDSGVIPAVDTWYWYRIEVIDTGTRTEIRAKIWQEGSAEPAVWQIDAYDDGPNRLTSGKIGLWSFSSGSKYWDDIAVEILGPVNQPPVAVGGADPVIGEASLPVDFSADGSFDNDGSIVLYEWDFESDGLYDFSDATSGSTPHTYTDVGTYTATLRVTDNEDATDTDTVAIEVVAALATVPDCVGLSHTNAQTALTDAGLVEGTVSMVYHATVPADDVISQNPAADTSVPVGSAVDLEVSLGQAPMVDVPNCVGLPQAEAVTDITDAGLTVGAITTAVSESVPAGNVISQNPAAETSVLVGSAVDLVVSLGEAQGFEEYAVGADPDYWLDTGANNSLTEDDSLFKTADVDGDMAFGTSSTLTNIHSHYLAETYDAMEGFVFTGRMRMSASNSGIGVTFLSDYPDSDTYYRLRRYGTNAFHLSSHNTAALSGVTDSGVIPAVDTWYWYRIEVIDTGTRTEIRAKIWQEGSAEPAVWQIDAYDDGPNRLTRGKIGLWSYSAGSKYWDDIAVEILGPVNQAPVAVGGADPAVVEASLPVDFSADGSFDNDGSIVLYEWDFESDGLYDFSDATSGSTPHTYTDVGTYTATLRVTDNEDATDTDTVAIEVVAALATVPDCVGLSHTNAQTALTDAGLVEGTVSMVYHATVPADDVISQNPAADTSVPVGSAVDLEVSLGQAPMVDVPNCVGLPQAEAVTDITDAGLTVGAITTAVSESVPAGNVISQNPAAETSVLVGSAVDLVVSLGEAQGFEEYAVGADPDYWLDTGANNSLTESDLFEVFDLAGEKVFGTASTLTNIHSHYLAETYDAMEGFVFTGRMRMSASNSGIGVTFLSDYPDSDTYYRLRRYRTNAFHLSPHGTDPLSGTLDSDVIPAADTWYFYKIEVTATVAQTQIRAKVWEQGTGEPADWQIDAYDDGPNRLTRGKIGLWSYSAGSKYWDDLAVVFLTP